RHLPHPTPPTLLPYTTLFRSNRRSPGKSSPYPEGIRRVRGFPHPNPRKPSPWGIDYHACDLVSSLFSIMKSSSGIFQLSAVGVRSEEHTSELQSRENLVCRLL